MHSRLLHSISTDGFLLFSSIHSWHPDVFPLFSCQKMLLEGSGRHEHDIIYLVEVLIDLPALGLAAWVVIQHMYFSTG